MKKIVKKILPESILNDVRKARRKQDLTKLYNFDKKRFELSAYDVVDEFSQDNLRSKITFHYHAIEKGLSNANLRYQFGKQAFTQLFFAMDKYIALNYPTNDSRFQQAITVITCYVELHKQNGYEIDFVEHKLEQYLPLISKTSDYNGGFGIVHKIELPNFKTMNFSDLATHRYSIRDYGEERISDEDVISSIQLATKTPSVCNRQAWRVHYIKNQDKISELLKIQGGLTTNGENIQGLILVTCSKEYMNGPHERNQTYIDGGLFTMTLLYSLTANNIATCPLNTDFNLDQETKIRSILDIDIPEDLICFISLGAYPEMVKYAKSPRDEYTYFTKIYE